MAGLARGKIIYGDASGDPAALTVGSNGQALVSDGTDISWGSAGASLANDGNNRIVTGDGSGGLNGEANLTFDGTNLDLGDSKKIRLGASQDLEIYHDGSHSIIKDGGIGNLQIRGEDVKLYNPDATETLAEFIFNGANKFYYNNNLRAKTVDEGFNVGHRLSVGAVEVPSNPNIRFLMDETSYDLGVGTYAGNLANGYGSWDLTGADKKITVIHHHGRLATANSGATCVDLNRCSNDGEIISFRQDATQEGTISVSGSTIAYNTFCGTHWSRLADNSKPTILRGTVMESIDEVMDWYQAKFLPSTLEDIPDNYVKQPIALPEGKNVGDTFEYTTMPPEGQSSETVTATIIKEDNEQLPKVKVSDTEDSKAVYGVFMDWDDTDDGEDGDVNDMNVASLGAFVVRIHKDETVAIGDYLQSKGDGTAKVQADDIMRASTIAKVTSTEKTHIHADSSYCVPCTLHCG
jgi:hypothetical protein